MSTNLAKTLVTSVVAFLAASGLAGCGDSKPVHASKTESSGNAAVSSPASPTSDALDLLFRSFNDYRLTGGWTRAEPTLAALGGRKIDQEQLPLLGIDAGKGFGFHILRGSKIAFMVGVNTKANSVAVLIPRTDATSEDLVREIGARLDMEKLGEEADIGQNAEMFAAWLGTDPLGLIVINTSRGNGAEPNMASVGILDWRSAVEAFPELKGVFLRRR
jgi:hypothetical protein